MHILSIDCVLGVTSLADRADGDERAVFSDTRPHHQAGQLAVLLQHFMQEAGLTYQACDLISCCTGPGGFTSVRIAVSFTRSLAYAAGIACHGVGLHEIMAYYATHMRSTGADPVTTVIPAGRKHVSCCDYVNHQPVAAPYVIARSALSQHHHYCAACDIGDIPALHFPVERTASLLADMIETTTPEHYKAPEPLYARPPDAKAAKPLLQS